MGDIDFDELDQAVNTLMSGAQKTAPAQVQNNPPVATPVNAVPTGVNNVAPVVQASVPQQATVPTTPATPVTPSPQIQINKGRFMDVKPPSATPVLPLTPTPTNDSSSVAAASPSTPNGVAMPAIGPVKPTQPAMEISTAQAPAQGIGAPTDQAAFSPFLPNAQVEKRPLGGTAMPSGAVPSPFDEQEKKPTPPAGSTQPEPMQSSEPILQNTAQPVEDSSSTPSTIDINNDQKAEVNQSLDDQRSLDAANYSYKQAPQQESELAKLESSEVVATPASLPATDKPQDESVRSVESGDTERLKGTHPWDAAKNQEEKAAEKAHGIYDEHQTLSHPAKQKSGWWIVIAIILVIIVVASLGVAAFFYFGPGL